MGLTETGASVSDEAPAEPSEGGQPRPRGVSHTPEAGRRILSAWYVLKHLFARHGHRLPPLPQPENGAQNYASSIFTKLRVADLPQAIVRAREAGLGKEAR